MMGYEDTDIEDVPTRFMEEPQMQDDAMAALVAENARALGTTDPVALAIAHYGGPGRAREYLASGAMSEQPAMTTGTPHPSVAGYARGFMDIPSLAPTVDDLLELIARSRR
jgi:hypothetical protein